MSGYKKIDLHFKSQIAYLPEIADFEWDSIILSSWFDSNDLISPASGECRLADSTVDLLRTCSQSLAVGGLLFIYGAPHRLPAYAAILDGLGDEWRMDFKYWIGIQLNNKSKPRDMQSAHVGLLLFHKVARKGITPFDIGSTVRVPHVDCPACGKNIRDWGGKKHLMNPEGVALSDVWLDLPARPIAGNRMPGDVLDRVRALAGGEGKRVLHLLEGEASVGSARTSVNVAETDEASSSDLLKLDSVLATDCVKYMESLLPEYENKAFDLIFADPPYNLDKMYADYKDAHAGEDYLAWCDKWLELCARLLKPGGTLFALNLPKWALHHARTLDKFLDFRHWIVWQALAEPRGKIMPAHYALLYYTKPGLPPVFNYRTDSRNCVGPLDSPEYCLRATCIKKRKGKGDDKKVPLTDIWSDIYRIRHKKDRDYHPCQLPEKLMERIIMLASDPGQTVFDPLCGVGTTAIASKRLGRHFVTTDIDPAYVEITKQKLSMMEENLQETGQHVVPRTPTKRANRLITKKHIETVIQELARNLNRLPEMEDVQQAYPEIYEEIQVLYPNPRKALAAARHVITPLQSKLEM